MKDEKKHELDSPRGEKDLCLFLCIDLNISLAQTSFRLKKTEVQELKNSSTVNVNITQTCIILSCSITCIFTG